MRIMFCLGSMTKGGAERVVANLANDFIKNNQISIVVTPPDESSYKLDKRISFRTLDCFDEKKSNVFFRTIKRIRKLKGIIKEEKPDIIISLIPEPTYRLMLATFFNKQTIIISVRNDPKVEYNTVFKRMLMKFLFKRADGFIFQTADAKSFFSKKIQDRSVIIPNPISDEFIVKPYTGKRNNHIVTVGRLVPQKNHKLLINAFNELQKEYKDYELHIYGEGELKDELIQLTIALGIDKKVFFKGNVDNIKDKIYDARMFVLSSDYEGMPNALMEAMALGIPSISTDCPCGGPSFLMKDKNNGILVSVNDSQDLTNAMIKLIEDEKYAKMIGDSANKIGSELNTKTINNKWYEYILNILNK